VVTTGAADGGEYRGAVAGADATVGSGAVSDAVAGGGGGMGTAGDGLGLTPCSGAGAGVSGVATISSSRGGCETP